MANSFQCLSCTGGKTIANNETAALVQYINETKEFSFQKEKTTLCSTTFRGNERKES